MAQCSDTLWEAANQARPEQSNHVLDEAFYLPTDCVPSLLKTKLSDY